MLELWKDVPMRALDLLPSALIWRVKGSKVFLSNDSDEISTGLTIFLLLPNIPLFQSLINIPRHILIPGKF